MEASRANTEVVPFSNGSDADHWQYANCAKCQRCPPSSAFNPRGGEFEDKGTETSSLADIRQGYCQLNVRLELGFFSGSIPAKTAWRIGAGPGDLHKSRSGNIYVNLPARCKEFIPQ